MSAKSKICYWGHGTWEMGHGTWDTGHGTWDWTQDTGLDTGQGKEDIGFRSIIN